MRVFFLTCVAIVFAGMADAQLRLGLEVVEGSVISYEPITAKVRLKNDTDELLLLEDSGASDVARVYFRVVEKNQGSARRRDDRPIMPRVVIRPGVEKEFSINLTPLFHMSEEGRYLVTAYVTWEGRTYATRPVVVDVAPGLVLAQSEKSVPGYKDDIRTYSLRYWNRTGKQLLFLSVGSREGGTNYGVFPLGQFMRLSTFPPRVEFGTKGEVKVRHQIGARVFSVTTFESVKEGVRLIGQEYHDETGKEVNPDELIEDDRPRSIDAPEGAGKPAGGAGGK